MNLPRRFWCHIDTSVETLPDNQIVETSEDAVHWVRESVRGVFLSFDRRVFHRTWGWLGDHRAMDAGVISLQGGRPYEFAVKVQMGSWLWSAHPVRVLPLATPCGSPASTSSSRPPIASEAS